MDSMGIKLEKDSKKIIVFARVYYEIRRLSNGDFDLNNRIYEEVEIPSCLLMKTERI